MTVLGTRFTLKINFSHYHCFILHLCSFWSLYADYAYCLSFSGKHLSMLPVEPKLGKMLIFGAIFNCLDPILTIVSGLSVRDPFLTPFDKKDVSIP